MYQALIDLLNLPSEYNIIVAITCCILVCVFVITIINLLYNLFYLLFKRG